jgi:dethiobiotin synthetase
LARISPPANVPIDLVCPQRFLAAVAPNVAARQDGTTVSSDLLISGVSEWQDIADVLIMEGAGGVFCPLSDELTVLDFAIQMQAPVLVVAANRLGVISHTRLTVERLRQSGLNVAGVILNELQESDGNDASLATNAQQISHWLPDIALLHVGFRSDLIILMHHDTALKNLLLAGIVDRY